MSTKLPFIGHFYEVKLGLKKSNYPDAKRFFAICATLPCIIMTILGSTTFPDFHCSPITKSMLLITGTTMSTSLVLSTLLTCCYAYTFSFSNIKKRFLAVSI